MKRDSKGEIITQYSPDLIVASHLKGHTHSLDFHSHRQYEIFLFHGGECKYLINNQIVELDPGTIVLLDGTELHKAHVTSNIEDYERSTVHFSPDWIKPLLEVAEASFLLKTFFNSSHTIYTVDDEKGLKELDDALHSLVDFCRKPATKERGAELRIRFVQVLFLFHRLEKATLPDKQVAKSEKDRYAEQIASYTQKHFNEKLTIERIAGALNLSVSYVSHLFKEVTGYTVMEYLMDYRLTQAKSLIELSGKTKRIKEIATECGFESDAHFNRFFKKKTGLTPRQYQKMLQRV